MRVLKFICQGFPELASGACSVQNANSYREICPTPPAEDMTQTYTTQRTLVLTTIKAGSHLRYCINLFFIPLKRKEIQIPDGYRQISAINVPQNRSLSWTGCIVSSTSSKVFA